jgi:hypothetical protein
LIGRDPAAHVLRRCAALRSRCVGILDHVGQQNRKLVPFGTAVCLPHPSFVIVRDKEGANVGTLRACAAFSKE